MSETEIRNCEDALRHLAAYLDRELKPPGAEQLERHLDTCRSCYSRAEFEQRLKERVAELGRERVAPELSERVQTLVRTFNVAGGGRRPAGT
jgi:anti-sigma factor (TIGR02949 family)